MTMLFVCFSLFVVGVVTAVPIDTKVQYNNQTEVKDFNQKTRPTYTVSVRSKLYLAYYIFCLCLAHTLDIVIL